MHVRNKTLIKHLPFSRGAGLVQGCKPNINTHDILSIQNTFQKFGTLTVPIGHVFIAHHSHKHGNFLRDVRFRLFCKKAEIRNSSASHCLSIKSDLKKLFFWTNGQKTCSASCASGSAGFSFSCSFAGLLSIVPLEFDFFQLNFFSCIFFRVKKNCWWEIGEDATVCNLGV
jgi:hypothetical protein